MMPSTKASPVHNEKKNRPGLRFGAAISLAVVCLHAQPLRLVENGRPLTILETRKASEVDRFAARELARYLQQITGQLFPIQNTGATGLLVGRSLAESAGIVFRPEELGADGFVLRRAGNRVFLAGISDRGTLYAVYAFLETLGCRWMAPNFAFYGAAGGEFVPRNPAALIGELDRSDKPSFQWRKKYVEEGESHNTENLKQMIDWMAKARLNVLDCPLDYQGEGRTKWDNWRGRTGPELKKRGMLIEVGGHGYQNFLPQTRYFDQHPDWFGMQNGKRSPAPNIVFSTANEQAVRTFIANVKQYLRERPEIDIFDCWPPDGSQWSDAPEDRALGSPAERQVLLLNRLAKDLGVAFPKLRVQFIAYEGYSDPPVVNKPAAGVVMEFCPINRSFESRLYEGDYVENIRYFRQLQAWLNGVIDSGSVSIYSYITKYMWRSLPILVPHLIADEARCFHSMGVGGISSYSEPAGWATFELDHYIMARTGWDADLNVDREIADYVFHRYGRAAPAVARYLQLVEDLVPHAVGVPGTVLQMPRQREMIDSFAKAQKYLNEARELAQSDAAVLLLLDKLSESRRYAENEMRLRLEFLEAAKGWRRGQIQRISDLIEEKKQIVQANTTTGVITKDQRVP
jgi:hypothetical protein